MSMLWAALCLPVAAGDMPSSEALRGLAIWALQFTPRVALVDEAVLLELQASLRLFGGKAALKTRLADVAPDLGVQAIGWAPTALAALALARSATLGATAVRPDREHAEGAGETVADLLDPLPIATLSAARPHLSTLQKLGCQRLCDLRQLPRAGLSRRFARRLLEGLDQAYGLRPLPLAWQELPVRFDARLELMARVETAPPMLFGARRLLLQLCGWLAARHCGVTVFSLGWRHDDRRRPVAPVSRGNTGSAASAAGFNEADDIDDGWSSWVDGSLQVRTGEATCEPEHLCRLLAEHLAHVQLAAPVGELRLRADQFHPLTPTSASLLPGPGSGNLRGGEEPLARVFERIAARLGSQRVLRARLLADHRPEAMIRWQPVDASPQPMSASPQPLSAPALEEPSALPPQPTWLLPEPLPLAVRGQQPVYQGPLRFIAGPHRIEGGWWDRSADADGQPQARNIQRDYWVVFSEHAGVLWIFQQRLAGERTGWFLHGVFA